ncbi:hypothetical protein ACFYOV_22580 [Streptomyces sp. NPDC005931]|uniref:hypothetical protein n=1 Tax=Streptomyces sp. NPDC005931 TaxID=3364737 RepID=UPI00369337C8
MKKRSMLAIASLATGFVVAAITPSHADNGLGGLDVKGPLGAVDQTLSADALDLGGQDQQDED